MTDAEWKQLELGLAATLNEDELAKLVVEHRRALHDLVGCFEITRGHWDNLDRYVPDSAWLRWKGLFDEKALPAARALLARNLDP